MQTGLHPASTRPARARPPAAANGNASFAARVDLCRGVLQAGETLCLHVSGVSMLPMLWPGERISVEARPVEAIVIGDIAVFARGDCFIVHRVIAHIRDATGAAAIVTRGDAMIRDDGLVSQAEVLGVVTAVNRRGTERRLPSRNGVALGLSWLAARSNLAVRVMVKAQRVLNRFDASAPGRQREV